MTEEMIVFLQYLFAIAGSFIFMYGVFNLTKKTKNGEKTTTGVVEKHGYMDKSKFWHSKYKTVVKANNKKYTIEAYSMPKLKEGEEVTIQMTGTQRVLGNQRLNRLAQSQLVLGTALMAFAFFVVTM